MGVQNSLEKEIWELATEKKIRLTAVHIPEVENKNADSVDILSIRWNDNKISNSLQDFLTTFPFPGGVVCKSSKFPNSIFLVGTESHGLQENRCLLSIP